VKRRLFALLLLIAGCSAHIPPPLPSAVETGFLFALIGDTPYSWGEALALDAMIEEIDREQPAVVIHTGDITSGRGPCSDEWFEARKRQLEKFRHPLVIVPGDNDWVDCHRTGFDPIERLNRFREVFESGAHSLGRRRIELERQSGRYAQYREHMRWIAADVLFVGLNVQGSNNNLGRTAEMDAEHRERMAAVLAWLEDSRRLAEQRKLAGMLIFAHADPDFEGKAKRRELDGFVGFRGALRDLAVRFGKPVLLVHGDSHFYSLDQPIADPVTGKPLRNFTRAIVFGSPQTRWIRGNIDPSSPQVFRLSPVFRASAEQ
jgi:predicted phosphodiesterase